jgi:membrane-associated phospholipid phosphatase
MAHPRELRSDELSEEALEPRRLALARMISIIFSPPFVAIATYFFVAFAEPQPLFVGIGWALLAMFIQMFPAAMLYFYRRKRGEYSDADVSRRQDRNELYLLGACAIFVSVLLLQWLNAPRSLEALAIGTLALGISCGLVNMFWKISMHAATIAACATITSLYAVPIGAVMWVCALAVGWARVKTQNHTPMQVVAGFVAAAIAMFTSFTLVAGV